MRVAGAVIGITGYFTCGFVNLKSLLSTADSKSVVASEQEAPGRGSGRHQVYSRELAMSRGVSQEVLHAAHVAAENAPDFRAERVSMAIAHLRAGTPDANKVARAMIARILAESSK